MAEEKKRMGPPVIKAVSSNTLSDAYRDSLAISYSFIGTQMPEISFEIGSAKLDTPIMAGPIVVPRNSGYTDFDLGKAAAQAGSIWWTHFHDKSEYARMLEAGLPVIRVIKPLADIDLILDEIRFDTEHGAVGYAMDISHGITVYGEPDGQQLPFAPKTVGELRRLNEASPLPFFLKDVMSVRDALLAREAGVSGIVLSGHNNRFPCAVPPLMLLPEIRKAVGCDFKIFIDGGLNSGYDVFKALALGADGVLCARALVAELVKGGPEAVTDRIRTMTAELKGAMWASGSADLDHIDPGCIVRM